MTTPSTGLLVLAGLHARSAEARGLGGRMLRWRGFAAATLGHTVLTARAPTERLLRHELVHVRQAERWGPLFVPLYLAGLLRYGYRRNPFERAAYAAAAGPAVGRIAGDVLAGSGR